MVAARTDREILLLTVDRILHDSPLAEQKEPYHIRRHAANHGKDAPVTM